MMDQLQVLYEDNHILGVIKPPGILSQSDRPTSEEKDMLSIIKISKAWKSIRWACTPSGPQCGRHNAFCKDLEGGIPPFFRAAKR